MLKNNIRLGYCSNTIGTIVIKVIIMNTTDVFFNNIITKKILY